MESALGLSANTYIRGRGKNLGVPHLIWAWAIRLLVSTGPSLYVHVSGLAVMVSMSFTELQGCLPCEVRASHSLLWFVSPLHLPLAPLCGWFPGALRPPGLVLVPPSSPLPSPLCHQAIPCISCSVCWECHSSLSAGLLLRGIPPPRQPEALYSACPLLLPLFPLPFHSL